MTGFYKQTSAQTYTGLDFSRLSKSQISQIVANGLTTYNKLYPPTPPGWFDKAVWTVGKAAEVAGVVVVGAMAYGAIAAAMASAGTVAATSAAESVATPAATAAAATAGTSSSVTMGVIANTAKGITTAGAMYTKITGKTPPEKLTQAAQLMQSPDMTTAIKTEVKKKLAEQNLKVDTNNKQADAALTQQIQNEQAKYAANLNAMAKQAAKTGQIKPVKSNWLTFAALGVGAVAMIIGH